MANNHCIAVEDLMIEDWTIATVAAYAEGNLEFHLEMPQLIDKEFLKTLDLYAEVRDVRGYNPRNTINFLPADLWSTKTVRELCLEVVDAWRDEYEVETKADIVVDPRSRYDFAERGAFALPISVKAIRKE